MPVELMVVEMVLKCLEVVECEEVVAAGTLPLHRKVSMSCLYLEYYYNG